ncbi:hypothetical protein KY363_01435 [Candidatus Woesearchaeota archaeon]|nr:hypothetical protein [Candidatus Woesearchaeota archaeon]
MRFALLAILSICVLTGIVRAVDKAAIQLSIELGPAAPNPNESFITIESESSYAIDKGDTVEIPLEIYRGKTLKRTVYVWLADSENRTVSAKAKVSLPDRFTAYNSTVNLTFSKCVPGGNLFFVAEGLDTVAKKEVVLVLSGCGPDNQSTAEEGEFSFSVLSAPDSVESGSEFSIRIMISNPTGQHLEVAAWSYVYRSSVSYSGDREQNMKTINVPEFSNVTFELENTVAAPEGNYSIKIKLLRSDRKTAEELTLPLQVSAFNRAEDGESDKRTESESKGLSGGILSVTGNAVKNISSRRTLFTSNVSNQSGSGDIVYLSSSAKAQRMAVYFLMAVLILVLVALIFRKL